MEPGSTHGPPPDRPAMSDRTPPPVGPAPEPVGAARVARIATFLAGVSGVVAVIMAFLDRVTLIEALRDRLADLQPDLGVEQRDGLSAGIYIAVLVALVLVFAGQIAAAQAMPRPGGRWTLVALFPIDVGVVVLALGTIALGKDALLLTVLLLGQVALAGVALVAAVVSRSSHPKRRHPR
jgi:hypothetical protein